MAKWPIIGRPVRIAVALIRLPTQINGYLELNKRHASDYDNLVKSVPVALRKITREMSEIREQLANEANTVAYLLGRVEFVRRELMFEMRYGAKTPTTDSQRIKSQVEILNPEKLAAARNQKLRLNLGCGHIPLEGYINIDRRALPGVDIVAEVDELPLEPGEVDEIFSAHLLVHFPQEQLRRELLPYWVGLLKTGGVFGAVVPDAESMIKGYAEGSYPYSALREVTFGGQDYDGDFHFNMFAIEQVEDLMMEAGLANIVWKSKGRKNGACYEMEFMAIRKGNAHLTDNIR